jgi:Fe-S cluster assembly protein SufD
LLLSSRAKVDTNPQLEIANNDVHCTHGATVGPIDESQRFYLMSRGLSAKTAEELIVFGFLQNVLERSTVWLPNQKALERIVRSQIGFLS